MSQVQYQQPVQAVPQQVVVTQAAAPVVQQVPVQQVQQVQAVVHYIIS